MTMIRAAEFCVSVILYSRILSFEWNIVALSQAASAKTSTEFSDEQLSMETPLSSEVSGDV